MTTMPRNKTAVPATSVSWRAAALATLTAAAILAPGSARADMAPAQGTAVDGVATVQRMLRDGADRKRILRLYPDLTTRDISLAKRTVMEQVSRRARAG